ncbi:MAG: DUF962 domain-containing protein [Sphingosinicella sp.]|nr:DUF962 domain-containing protein [Sphingosinicella sp.]
MRKHKSFAEFWPFYLREHARPRTRAFHYAGTSLVIFLAVVAFLTGNLWLLLAMPVAGYGFAWASHAAIEHNRPATFTYPRWSLLADFKMWALWLSGRIEAELAAAGVRPDGQVDRPLGE